MFIIIIKNNIIKTNKLVIIIDIFMLTNIKIV
jgi:hypothetical protein